MSQFRLNGYTGQDANGHVAQNEDSVGEVIVRPEAKSYRMNPGGAARYAKYAGEQFENPTDIILQKLEAQGCQPRLTGTDQWEALCPVHQCDGLHSKDEKLQISIGKDDRCLLHCFVHGKDKDNTCNDKTITAALGLRDYHLYRPCPESLNGYTNGRANGKPKPDRTHVYQDQHGDAVYKSLRRNGNWFQERYDVAEGKFVGGGGCMKGVPLVPYMLPDLLQRLQENAESVVYIAEGEKDVEALWGLHMPATCNVGGADKWRDEYTEWFKGRKVVVFQDNDEPGRRHAQKVAKSCHAAGCHVRVLGVPEPHKDVSDFIAAGKDRPDLMKLIRGTPDWTPSVEPETKEPETPPDETFTGKSGRTYRFNLVSKAEDLQEEPIDWLWENRIPFGFLTLFAGRTGSGKSLLAGDISARLSVGGEIPLSGGKHFEPASSLIISEDPIKRISLPRMRIAGADRSKIRFMTLEAMADFCLNDQQMIEDMYEEAGCPRLITIDPPANFLGGKDENSNEQVRSILKGLVAWTEQQNVAVILITHLNKGSGKQEMDNLDRIMGSVAWTTSTRVVHNIGPHPSDDNLMLIKLKKSNIGRMDRSIVYRLDPIEQWARVNWCYYTDIDKKKGPSPRAKNAEAWMAQKFRERVAWPSEELKALGREEGISPNAIWEVKQAHPEIRWRIERTPEGTNAYVWFTEGGKGLVLLEDLEEKAQAAPY